MSVADTIGRTQVNVPMPTGLATLRGDGRLSMSNVGQGSYSVQPGLSVPPPGAAKVVRMEADGRTVVLALLGLRDLAGEINISKDTACSTTSVTPDEATLVWIDRVTGQRVLHMAPALAMKADAETTSARRRYN